jgi:hypothetical protein
VESSTREVPSLHESGLPHVAKWLPSSVGAGEGFFVGAGEGFFVGAGEGFFVGAGEGIFVGCFVGVAVFSATISSYVLGL